MALIESLKAFYKDNVENADKLNDADSVLEVLRAKYGNYKGSNIEEYFKELVNNGISPGGGVAPTGTIAITENGEGINVSSYAYADVNVSGGGGDFSTATVTLTGTQAQIFVPCVFEGTDPYIYASPIVDSSPVTVILYKGKCSMACQGAFMSSTDETVEIIGGTMAMITGDCTITFSAS